MHSQRVFDEYEEQADSDNSMSDSYGKPFDCLINASSEHYDKK